MDEANELRSSLQLIGTVKSVIFQNEENGYTVLRLDVGGDEPVTVVGCLPFAAPGEGLTVEGAWERHPSHGEQFKASSAMRSLPVGEKHIYEYLASGAVRGIGPATAAVLVNRFGSRTLEILSDSPEKLAENFNALMGAVIKAKPAAAKGQYIRSCTVASTMGPGIKVATTKI